MADIKEEKVPDSSPTGRRTGYVKIYNGTDSTLNFYYHGKNYSLLPNQSIKASEHMAKLIFAWEPTCTEDFQTSMRLLGITDERKYYRDIMPKIQITPIVAKEE
ncbi:hypothetical protein EM20IM_06240 [Candidatus Methylacidiphilum infernorum]|uniref:Phage protein n=1 Tax=Candidatus Methylacidiphilum infernorum TaxID=511746 RepID=A0ABX7PTI2_9BACT|nr:hypothetical protein [Candidatus Methylacidiphilum infernorum]QSR86110.1 hypothetical protein EM20IM_06240 [Candidatus Methylacidiphilum infernorum]